MRQLTILVAVIGLLGVAATWSVTGAPSASIPANTSKSGLAIRVEPKNPFTHLEVNNRPNSFQFAIVSDRTGGRRPGVFTKAVEKINLLQPEFVVSVGDLIEGYSEDPGAWALEWSEFENKLTRLQMPFFFCPGNHDIANLPMSKEWHRKFGRSYYPTSSLSNARGISRMAARTSSAMSAARPGPCPTGRRIAFGRSGSAKLWTYTQSCGAGRLRESRASASRTAWPRPEPG